MAVLLMYPRVGTRGSCCARLSGQAMQSEPYTPCYTNELIVRSRNKPQAQFSSHPIPQCYIVISFFHHSAHWHCATGCNYGFEIFSKPLNVAQNLSHCLGNFVSFESIIQQTQTVTLFCCSLSPASKFYWISGHSTDESHAQHILEQKHLEYSDFFFFF